MPAAPIPCRGGRAWAPARCRTADRVPRLGAPPERVAVRVGGADHPLRRGRRRRLRAARRRRPPAGDDYWFVLDGTPWPDPCTRWQPEGLRGPSRVVDTDALRVDRRRVRRARARATSSSTSCTSGRSAAEGTFDGGDPAPRRRCAELGVTAIELMPVADVPGRARLGLRRRLPRAAHRAYGGPQGLARLVDAAHGRGPRA